MNIESPVNGIPISDPQPKKPRVWTLALAAISSIILAVVLQAVVAIAIAVIEITRGVEPDAIGERLMSIMTDPYGFIVMAAMGQVAFGIGALVPARLSPEPFRERLGLRPARPSWRIYPIVMVGSIAPLAVSLGLAILIAKVIPADESIAQLFDAMTPVSAAVFVVFIGVAPGLFEELLFRGYIQQRLQKRWGPAVAIVVTSIVFGLAHITPHAIAVALVLGLWFGYVAWRSDSILPAMLCHFFVNSGLNAWRVLVKFAELSPLSQNVAMTCFVLVGTACFLVCFLPSFWSQGTRQDSVMRPIV